jgi:hypothetical protein
LQVIARNAPVPVARRPDNLTQSVRVGRGAPPVVCMPGGDRSELRNRRVHHLMSRFNRGRPVCASGIRQYRHQVEALTAHNILGNRMDVVRPGDDIGSVFTQRAPPFGVRWILVRVERFGRIDSREGCSRSIYVSTR